MDSSPTKPHESVGFLHEMMNSITSSPTVSVFTIAVVTFVYYFFFRSQKTQQEIIPIKLPEPLPKGDMTVEELRQYNGLGGDKRVCIAVKGEIFDVTKGSRFYGPEGPYALLAGHDATRALATWSVDAVKDEWDDHEGLSASEISSVDEWVEQFREKYDYVGRLVRTEEEKSRPSEKNDDNVDDKGS